MANEPTQNTAATDPQVDPVQTVDPATGQTAQQPPIAPKSRRQKEVAPAISAPQMPETSAGSSETATSTEQVGSGPVEVEPAKELEPEVEKVVERIKDKKVKGPDETVISADTKPKSVPKTVAQPVVVLPLTEKGMKKGRSKGVQHSIRWLYTWCVRQIKKLRDFMVVYREDQ